MSMRVRVAGFALLGLAAAIVGFNLQGAHRSRAAASALAVTPPSQVVQVGEPVKLDINVSGVADLAAWEIVLKYDPSVLSFSSYQQTDWLNSTGRQQQCPSAVVNSTLGTAQFGCVSLGSTPPGVNGDGTVAHVTLNANAAGTSNLEVIKVLLSDPLSSDGCCPPQTVNEGVVRVAAAGDSSGGGSLPATPTPNPVKLTPTAVNGASGGSLTLDPGANATAAAAQASGGASGGSSGGANGAPSGVVSSGTSGGLFSGSGSQARPAGTGAPHAGTGSTTGVPSRASLAVAAGLGLLGLACLLGVGVRPLARVLVRRRR